MEPTRTPSAGKGWEARLGRLPVLPRLVRLLRARHREIGRQMDVLRRSLVSLAESPMTATGEILERARRDVTTLTDAAEYRGLYRSEEMLYWLHLPGWIGEWAAQNPPRRILDIGSGYGTLSAFASMLTGAQVFCLDNEPQRISEALRAKHRLTVARGNIEQVPIPWTGPMDAVILTEIIEHFNFHPVATMQKIAAHMGRDARLFLSTPDAASWGRVPDGYRSYRDMPPPDPDAATIDLHIYQYTETELRQVLDDSGFVVLRLERAPGRWGFHLNVEAQTAP